MHHETIHLSKEEQIFSDFLRQGDDFYKIGLFNNAKDMYTHALQCKIDVPTVEAKLKLCLAELKYTRKVALILVVIVAIVVAIVNFI